jgi:hypothetical protein
VLKVAFKSWNEQSLTDLPTSENHPPFCLWLAMVNAHALWTVVSLNAGFCCETDMTRDRHYGSFSSA